MNEVAVYRQASELDVEQPKEWWEDMPHEQIVAAIRSTITEARVDWDAEWGKGSFDPIMFIGEKLSGKLMSPWHRHSDKERYVSYAWDALTQPYLKSSSYQKIIFGIIRDVSEIHGRHVTLPPKGVKLLDALTDAVGVKVPRAQGDRTVDLYANIPALRNR